MNPLIRMPVMKRSDPQYMRVWWEIHPDKVAEYDIRHKSYKRKWKRRQYFRPGMSRLAVRVMMREYRRARNQQ